MEPSSSFTWDDVRNQVRRLRTQTQASFSNHNIWTCKNFYFHPDQPRIYFLSNCIPPNQTSSRQFILYQADFGVLCTKQPDATPPLTLKWVRVFNEYQTQHEGPIYYGSPQRNGGYHERTRPLQTLSSFQMADDTLLMMSMGNIYTGALGQIPKVVLSQYMKSHKIISATSMTTILTQSTMDEYAGNKSSKQTIDPATSFENKALYDTSIRSDPKLGGTRNNLFAFIRNRDIWISDFNGVEVQLTFCSDQSNASLSCGVAEYVMQEEFHRRSGYYWRPSTLSVPSDANQILYLETNEENVELIRFSKQNGKPYTTTTIDCITPPPSARYPRAGRPNATSQLCLLEFTNEVSPLRLTTLHHKRLRDRNTIHFLYPWAEYIVRLGWLPDGESIWVQVLSRDQTKTAVIRIPCILFKTDEDYELQSKTDIAKVEELWTETQETWINVSDVYYFLQKDKTNIVEGRYTNFIWSSELSGYRHLYYVTKRNDNNEAASICQLTHGEWCVVDKTIYVDQRRKLVYFMAKKDTPLEAHLYVTTYDFSSQHHPRPIRRLTCLGYNHHVEMDNSLEVFVDQASCLQQPNGIVIRRLQYSDTDPLPTTNDRFSHGHDDGSSDSDKDNIAILMPAMKDINDIEDFDTDVHFQDMVIARPSFSPLPTHCCAPSTEPLSKNSSLSNSNSDNQHLNRNYKVGTAICPNTIDKYDQRIRAIPEGQIFDFMTSDGVKLYGCLYKPRLYQPGKSYPTILQIYGGPKTQMVTNEFKFPRLLRYLMAVYFGFAVVVIDGRGSCDRGLAFESYVKGRLGMVEIQDQLEGLDYLATSRFGATPVTEKDGQDQQEERLVSVVDLERVAVTGWSYGGYLSLMALARYNDVFKISIAGAPVTKWELYDSAYTERYMGMPLDRPESFRESSILNWVDKFPDTENRLVIVHGLIDENVHFTNSEILVSQLAAQHKPYHLQVYPTEKHGLRHSSVNEHFDILMFHCLLNNL